VRHIAHEPGLRSQPVSRCYSQELPSNLRFSRRGGVQLTSGSRYLQPELDHLVMRRHRDSLHQLLQIENDSTMLRITRILRSALAASGAHPPNHVPRAVPVDYVRIDAMPPRSEPRGCSRVESNAVISWMKQPVFGVSRTHVRRHRDASVHFSPIMDA